MLRSIRKSRQSGFTLVELGIVLALIGIGLFFAISKMQETGNTSRAQNAATDISAVITNLQRFYGTAALFPSTIDSAALIGNRLVPDRWVNRTGGTPVMIGPFGAAPSIASASSGNEATISFSDVPIAVCAEMVRLVSDGVRSIKVGSTDVKLADGALDIGAMGTACAAGTNGVVTTVFQFRKA